MHVAFIRLPINEIQAALRPRAEGQSQLTIVYHVLANPDITYVELGSDHFERLNQGAIERRAVKQLRNLGYDVTLTPLPAA